MPYKPKHPCGYPRCPELTDKAFCEKHEKKRIEEYNKYRRDDFTKSFYTSKEWRLTRKRHLKEQPFCIECMKVGKIVKATIVDHIVPIKQGGAKYDSNNLQSLCWSCHSRKSVKEGSRYGQGESKIYRK